MHGHDQESTDYNDHASGSKQKNMYQTDPQLIWDDSEERRRETEEQLLLER